MITKRIIPCLDHGACGFASEIFERHGGIGRKRYVQRSVHFDEGEGIQFPSAGECDLFFFRDDVRHVGIHCSDGDDALTDAFQRVADGLQQRIEINPGGVDIQVSVGDEEVIRVVVFPLIHQKVLHAGDSQLKMSRNGQLVSGTVLEQNRVFLAFHGCSLLEKVVHGEGQGNGIQADSSVNARDRSSCNGFQAGNSLSQDAV